MKKDIIRFIRAGRGAPLDIPKAGSSVAAGFPSPADDYMEGKLDLNEHLVAHPAATFFVKVRGDSMIGAGILSGDLLVVDRSCEAANKDIVLAVVNGEFTVKRLIMKHKKPVLKPENDDYPLIEIGEDDDFQVWGVVQWAIHEVK